MKRTIIGLLVTLGVLTFLPLAFAGNTSYSINVSCTIPAIPGINVPLEAAADDANAGKEQAQEETTEKESFILVATQEGADGVTKTIYSR
ncbi:MAG: hypothetical protein M0R66_04570 [Candidatus Omnitrophica bacterium]|nr:hypothetical protein [Candidatus Omnitrophota bacterium]